MNYTKEQQEKLSIMTTEMYNALIQAKSQIEGLSAWLEDYQPMVAKGSSRVIEIIDHAIAYAEGR